MSYLEVRAKRYVNDTVWEILILLKKKVLEWHVSMLVCLYLSHNVVTRIKGCQ